MDLLETETTSNPERNIKQEDTLPPYEFTIFSNTNILSSRGLAIASQIARYDIIYNSIYDSIINGNHEIGEYWYVKSSHLYKQFFFIASILMNRYLIWPDCKDKFLNEQIELREIYELFINVSKLRGFLSIDVFMYYLGDLLSIFFKENDRFSFHENRISKMNSDDMFMFPYFLIVGNETFSFDTIVDMLIGDEKMIKIPIIIPAFCNYCEKGLQCESDMPTDIFKRYTKKASNLMLNCNFFNLIPARNEYDKLKFEKDCMKKRMFIIYTYIMLHDYESNSPETTNFRIKSGDNLLDYYGCTSYGSMERVAERVADRANYKFLFNYIINSPDFQNEELKMKCQKYIELFDFIKKMKQMAMWSSAYFCRDIELHRVNINARNIERMIQTRVLNEEQLAEIYSMEISFYVGFNFYNDKYPYYFIFDYENYEQSKINYSEYNGDSIFKEIVDYYKSTL